MNASGPFMPLIQPASVIVASSSVRNVQPNPIWLVDIRGLAQHGQLGLNGRAGHWRISTGSRGPGGRPRSGWAGSWRNGWRLACAVLGITLVAFVLTHLVPGDPAAAALGQRAMGDPAAVQAFRHEYGLDKPVPEQYVIYLWPAAGG